MKLYLHDGKGSHIDARQVASYLKETPDELVDRLEDADCMLVLSGMYLTYGYAEAMEAELDEAVKKALPVLTVAPHGTPYIPMKLRKYTSCHCGLTKEAVLKMLEENRNRT